MAARTRTLAVFLPALIMAAACAPQQSLRANLQPRSLRALNLEETLGRRDELMLVYSLTAYDAGNKVVSVVNGAWGVESIRKNQTLALIPQARPISLALPRNGRVVASVVLIEIDDYSQALETLSRIRKIHNVVSLPAGLLLSATDLLTPLNYVTAGLLAAGIGVQLTDYLDTDDVLGQSRAEVRAADTHRSGQRLLHVPAQFAGQHLRNAYSYELTYEVRLRTVKLKSGR